jgi:hypothetical protein
MSPPYADPIAKSVWEATHRKDRSERYLRAVNWARGQVKMLRQKGVVHSREEWKQLLVSLIRSYLDYNDDAGESEPT